MDPDKCRALVDLLDQLLGASQVCATMLKGCFEPPPETSGPADVGGHHAGAKPAQPTPPKR